MVEVVLLQPPGVCKSFTRSQSIYPPLGLCQLAASGINIIPMQVIDAEGLGLDDNTTQHKIMSLQPKILGLTATTFTLDIVEKWAKWFKNVGIATIVGGPHATLSPYDLFEKCPSVDYIIRGEAEEIFVIAILHILEGTIPSSADVEGLCYRQGKNIFCSDTIVHVQNLHNIPFPKMDDLPIENYWCPDAKSRPMITLMTMRGCPHGCKFCSSSTLMGKKLRGWSVSSVVSFIEHAVEKLKVREISFVDDSFIINRVRILDLCEEIIRRNLRINWFCNARADEITEEIVLVMKEAGCHQVFLGFESGSPKILENVCKGITIDQLVMGAEILKNAKIDRSIGFVIGLPGENEKTVKESIQLAKQVRPEKLQFTRFTPLLGSPLANYQIESGGFHTQGEDQIGQWIKEAYHACQNMNIDR